MLLLRAVLLELLVCFHVVGGAVVFRRLFPRESPWLGFILPIFAVMAVCNFIEHFVPLTYLGWLLPFTLGGLLMAMIWPGYLRLDRFVGRNRDAAPSPDAGADPMKELIFPAILFVGIFTWDFCMMNLNPSITCNTEGVADMARVLDFCLGNKLPPVDTWCPPYDHGGYYSFQHYGASLVKRLFMLDIGTGYNMGYNLLNTLTCFVGVGAAYSISGRKMWVALAATLLLLANFTGASVILIYWNNAHYVPNIYDIFDSRLAVDIGDGWNDAARNNPFGWIWSHGNPPPVLRLFTPTFNTYFPEFHANLGGHFMTLATLLAANEAFRTERSNWPWICLLVFPLVTIITATWFMIVVSFLCVGCIATALIAGRRPAQVTFVIGGAALIFVLLWPSVNTLIAGSYPVDFHWTPRNEYTAPWEFVIQWWPVIVPWIALCFVWLRLSLLARWIHLALPLLLIFFELFTFEDRGLTIEKNWGAIYGAGLVTFLPLVMIQREVPFRFTSFVYFFLSVIFVGVWAVKCYDIAWPGNVLHLRGDVAIVADGQKKRLLQVLQRMHGKIILNGKSAEAYNESPSLVGFSENMCYIAWFFQEYQCGHGGEAEFRDQQSNAFFAGTMPNPLAFLRSNDIAAVVIYPDDNIPDDVLKTITDQIGSSYFYIDCKGDGARNAGVFLRLPAAYGTTPTAPVK